MTIAATSNIFREHPILDIIKRQDGLMIAEMIRQLGTRSHDDVLTAVRDMMKSTNLSI